MIIRFISSWTFVWEDQEAVHVRNDMLKTCWPWHAEEPNMPKQFRESLLADLLHTVFMFLLCDIGTKKLLVIFNYHVLIDEILQNIQYMLLLDVQMKYSWKLIIVSYNTVLYTIPILHFSIDNHTFFVATATRNIGLFFRFVGIWIC